MPDQDTTGVSPRQGETSDALKDHVENPQYTETKPEEVKEKHDELHEIMKKNKEEVKRREQSIDVARKQIEENAPKPSTTDKADKQDVKKQADEIMAIQDADQQIQRVVELATQKDPFFAIKVAQELDDNFVLDQVHDELIEDKVRNILVDKGLLKQG